MFFFFYLFIFLIYFLLFYCKFSSGPQINSLQANSCLVWGGGLRHPPYQSWTWLCKASLATNWYFQIIAYLFLNQNRQNPGTAENKKKRRKNKNKQKKTKRKLWTEYGMLSWILDCMEADLLRRRPTRLVIWVCKFS